MLRNRKPSVQRLSNEVNVLLRCPATTISVWGTSSGANMTKTSSCEPMQSGRRASCLTYSTRSTSQSLCTSISTISTWSPTFDKCLCPRQSQKCMRTGKSSRDSVRSQAASGNSSLAQCSSLLRQSRDLSPIKRVTRGTCASCRSKSSCCATIVVQWNLMRPTYTTRASLTIRAMMRLSRSWTIAVLIFLSHCLSCIAQDCSQDISSPWDTQDCRQLWTHTVQLRTAKFCTIEYDEQQQKLAIKHSLCALTLSIAISLYRRTH